MDLDLNNEYEHFSNISSTLKIFYSQRANSAYYRWKLECREDGNLEFTQKSIS